MGKTAFAIKIVDSVDEEAAVQIYREAGWWRDEYNPSFINDAVAGSFKFAAAFHGDRLIGIGRLISDGVSDAYIQDVAVLRGFRGRGVGSEIIRRLVAEARASGIDWIALIGEPGTEGFYQRLGFKAMSGYHPMQLDEDG